jgi:hypothetical protein
MALLPTRRAAYRTHVTTPMSNHHHGHHAPHHHHNHRYNTRAAAAPVAAPPATTMAPRTHHQKHHATIGDKVSGALLKLRGKLTRRSGKVGAGTKRMHGTDGRGSRRSGWTTGSRKTTRRTVV